MNKTKLLTVAVIALLLLNFGMIGYLIFSKPGQHSFANNRKEKGGPKEVIIKKLHFDAIQIKQYQILIDAHRSQIRTIEGKISDAKNELYLLLKQVNINEQRKVVLIDSLSSYQSEIESVHFKHFQAIKMICKNDQLQDFNELTAELSKLFSKRPKPRND